VKTIIITGAGHDPGIGHALAKMSVAQGFNVCVNSRTFDPHVLEFYHEHDCLTVPGDITDPETQRRLLDACQNQWNKIDYLVNNASTGAAERDQQQNITRQCWVDNFVLNAVVPWEFSMMARPYLAQQKGSIVNVSSRAALQPGLGNNTAYAVSKAAMNNITQQLALTLAPDITVNGVCPGLVASKRLKNILKDNFDIKLQSYKDSALMGGPIDLDEVARLILHLLGNRSIVGQNIPICGGTTIQPVGMITMSPGQTC
jgi:3-oxoacyl-[acyl-carrier protein] reductase